MTQQLQFNQTFTLFYDIAASTPWLFRGLLGMSFINRKEREELRQRIKGKTRWKRRYSKIPRPPPPPPPPPCHGLPLPPAAPTYLPTYLPIHLHPLLSKVVDSPINTVWRRSRGCGRSNKYTTTNYFLRVLVSCFHLTKPASLRITITLPLSLYVFIYLSYVRQKRIIRLTTSSLPLITQNTSLKLHFSLHS